MFEFTREFILNDLENVKMNGSVLMVPKKINIEASKVHSIHHAPYYEAKNEEVSIPAGSLGKGGALTITIGQEGRVISLVSSRDAENQKDYIFNGAPADWKRQFDRQAAMEDVDRLIDLDFTSGLKIKALDCYTRVLKVTLVTDKVVDDKVVGEDVKEWTRKAYWQKQAGFEATQTLEDVTLTPGTEGMGTIARLQNNNRVLTAANITPYGFDMDERPRPGFGYDQWTIQYVSERRHQTAGVFGAIDHSLVTLVFFVPAELKNGEGDDALTFAGLINALIAKTNGVQLCEVAPKEAVDTIPGNQGAAPAKAEDEKPIEAKEDVIAKRKETKANAAAIAENHPE